MSRRLTLVSFHAHPDDEALLTGGTLAKVSALGHRVVLVVATAGESGLSDEPPGPVLARTRADELARSARALGIARVELLGFGDSGWQGDPTAPQRPGGLPPGCFASLAAATAAAPLARILAEEHADILTVYDPAGGYGHPDHVQVHQAGLAAAALAGTPVVLEATLVREPLRRGARLARLLGRLLPLPTIPDLSAAYTRRDDLTHVVDVRGQWPQKRAALLAHRSQTSGGTRTITVLTEIPLALLRLLWGRESYRLVRGDPDQVSEIFTPVRARPPGFGQRSVRLSAGTWGDDASQRP